MSTGAELYLDLMKKTLTNTIYQDAPLPIGQQQVDGYQAAQREKGRDWPSVAHTMVGRVRLDYLERCMRQVVEDEVPGDFIETGVWRGGVCIFMRSFLRANDITDRRVWVADSFQGIPDTNGASHPLDVKLGLDNANSVLGVSIEQVRENFERYDLLDDQVVFLEGWFRDSLPTAPVRSLAVLRLDGDLYESTMDALVNLYPKLSVGGFVIVDDHILPSCRQAIREFREANGITDTIEHIDWTSIGWRRTG
ncbi:TylF/MycF family methyltransferase [Nonomuraea purpurea]|uniref:TylF/MycF family methyltransferase n=1 Tax=Nonomuraea purpurea TaxID=1849276 RepID=A0ABV8GLK1_9ACTN